MCLINHIQNFINGGFYFEVEMILRNLNYPRNSNMRDVLGTTILHVVASSSLDNLDSVQFFFGSGESINVLDDDHHTPLHLAILWQNYKIADFLITKGAAVNIQDQSGKTALHCLIKNRWLMKLNNQKDKLINSLELFKRLLQNGADPNLPDHLGDTPLMQAVNLNEFGIVKELLNFGGNVHLRNSDLDTCLHKITMSSEPSKDILEELVKHGACVNCFNGKGISVIDYILQNNRLEEGLKVAKILIKTATLVNWENKIFFEIGKNHKFYLQEVIDSCYAEVFRMKSFAFPDKSNLCHFALNSGNDPQDDKSSGNGIFDEVLETLMKENFPIYEDFICNHFDRTFLTEKSSEMKVYARNEERQAVYLNCYVISKVITYLSDKDLFNLVRAYAKPDCTFY